MECRNARKSMKSVHETQMLADAQLSAEIVPAGASQREIRRVLLTGATGFLGAQTLGELLRSTDWDVVCLIRADDDAHAEARLQQALHRAGLAQDEARAAIARVRVVRGNVAEKYFGLD